MSSLSVPALFDSSQDSISTEEWNTRSAEEHRSDYLAKHKKQKLMKTNFATLFENMESRMALMEVASREQELKSREQALQRGPGKQTCVWG